VPKTGNSPDEVEEEEEVEEEDEEEVEEDVDIDVNEETEVLDELKDCDILELDSTSQSTEPTGRAPPTAPHIPPHAQGKFHGVQPDKH
jgi:hypothetical protein